MIDSGHVLSAYSLREAGGAVNIFSGSGFDAFMSAVAGRGFRLSLRFFSGFLSGEPILADAGRFSGFHHAYHDCGADDAFVHTLAWPQNPMFYAAVAVTVMVGTSSDVRTFNASAKFGAGMVSRRCLSRY